MIWLILAIMGALIGMGAVAAALFFSDLERTCQDGRN